ncbi:zinc-dependent alcohol dehydrogenase family protein [Streptomyces sp. NPDC056956]|uniref:zinc-dependent alcohol dehydrogenase family protein n=1 Tax=Streptomyces sp. NPDC056956 TaxID=3345980 RepID=UPI003629DB9F
MRAVVFERYGEPAEVRQVPDPEPAGHGVVVRVEATGLCRSDWHGWQGHDPDIALPHVPGHELAGVVETVGDLVTGWRPGDRVTVPFVCACGSCPACAAGDQQVCERQTQPGFTHWGSFAEYVALDHADVNLVAVPDDMSFATAASLGCRFATAYRAVVQQGRVAAGEWVAVHGCGGVGLSAVMIAAASGARVVAVDVAPGALEMARRFGAAECLDASSADDPAEAVRDLTGGGAHLSLDALGSPATCAASVNGLRRRGRHVQVGLLPSATGTTPVPMARAITLELELLGSHGMAAHGYPPMLELVRAGRLRPDLLVTRTIGLDAAPAALAALDTAPGPGVTVIAPWMPTPTPTPPSTPTPTPTGTPTQPTPGPASP